MMYDIFCVDRYFYRITEGFVYKINSREKLGSILSKDKIFLFVISNRRTKVVHVIFSFSSRCLNPSLSRNYFTNNFIALSSRVIIFSAARFGLKAGTLTHIINFQSLFSKQFNRFFSRRK